MSEENCEHLYAVLEHTEFKGKHHAEMRCIKCNFYFNNVMWLVNRHIQKRDKQLQQKVEEIHCKYCRTCSDSPMRCSEYKELKKVFE